MWIICPVDNSHEILRPIFYEQFKNVICDISCESYAWQTIHLKCQDLLSRKSKKKKYINEKNKNVVCFSCDWPFKD